MLYAAEVWCEPIRAPKEGGKVRQGSIGFANKFATIQRMAAVFTTGGMKSTPTTVLDAHADYLPIHLLINRTCQRAALRWATVAQSHPMFKLVRKAAKVCQKHGAGPLNKLYASYPIKPSEVETIKPARLSPHWIPGMVVRIAKDKETAIKEEADDTALIKIYSDGSGYKGGVGASAVMYRDGGRHGRTTRSLTAYLGTEEEQTVYVGELAGELMDLHLLATEKPGPTGLGLRVSVYVDNQASLLALDSIKPKSGGFIADAIHQMFDRVRKKHPQVRVTFRWIPSHLEVPGNEEADRLAKLGAEGVDLSEACDLPPLLRKKLPLSKSALDMTLSKRIKAEATKVLRESKQWVRLQDIDPSMPSTAFRKTIVAKNLTRGQGTLYMQLRSGHAPLNGHLHRIRVINSPVCPACEGAFETVKHYLLECPATNGYRRPMLSALGLETRPELKHLLGNRKAIKPLFKFIERTRRFKDDFGALKIAEEQEKDKQIG